MQSAHRHGLVLIALTEHGASDTTAGLPIDRHGLVLIALTEHRASDTTAGLPIDRAWLCKRPAIAKLLAFAQ